MAKRRRTQSKPERRVRVRGVRRERIDLQRLGRAIVAIALEQAQAEADARAAHDANDPGTGSKEAS